MPYDDSFRTEFQRWAPQLEVLRDTLAVLIADSAFTSMYSPDYITRLTDAYGVCVQLAATTRDRASG